MVLLVFVSTSQNQGIVLKDNASLDLGEYRDEFEIHKALFSLRCHTNYRFKQRFTSLHAQSQIEQVENYSQGGS